MATDATGTPTSLGIPKFDTSNDAPSGLGFNAAMDAINTLLGNYVAKALVTTAGDLIYATGNAAVARLPIGTVGQFLSVSGGVPTWVPNPGGFSGAAAGGSLAGTYPNPTLAANSVASAQIVDGSVAQADLATAVIQGKKIQSGIATTDGSGHIAVTFGTAFASAPAVVATVEVDAGDGRATVTFQSTPTTTGFAAQATNGNTGGAITAVPVHWIAMGS